MKPGDVCIVCGSPRPKYARWKWCWLGLCRRNPVPVSVPWLLARARGAARRERAGDVKTQRIPIARAKAIADEYRLHQVIVVAWDGATGTTHVVTYGSTFRDCEQAAIGGNRVKKALGWPDEMCQAVPARVKRKAARGGSR